ncbi:hypothetical protein HK097_005200 [Rhizophlyctis rosea]|uniref:Uncharacterized protein n=1 Tax=Rhizophlyctis rosea TaxID=64517 RepID=A0AAD5SGZ3_9FUNG|nr:hypothetical protein HK097_005200 [Rhizophlyctis rosea]
MSTQTSTEVVMNLYTAFPQLGTLTPNTRRRPIEDLCDVLAVTSERHTIHSTKRTIGDALDSNDLVLEQVAKKLRDYESYSAMTPEAQNSYLFTIIGKLSRERDTLKDVVTRVGRLELEVAELKTAVYDFKRVAYRCFADDVLRRLGFQGNDFNQFLSSSRLDATRVNLLKKLRENHDAAHELSFCVVGKCLKEAQKDKYFSESEWTVITDWFTERTSMSVESLLNVTLGSLMVFPLDALTKAAHSSHGATDLLTGPQAAQVRECFPPVVPPENRSMGEERFRTRFADPSRLPPAAPLLEEPPTPPPPDLEESLLLRPEEDVRVAPPDLEDEAFSDDASSTPGPDRREDDVSRTPLLLVASSSVVDRDAGSCD